MQLRARSSLPLAALWRGSKAHEQPGRVQTLGPNGARCSAGLPGPAGIGIRVTTARLSRADHMGPRGMARGEARAPPRAGDAPADRARGPVELNAAGRRLRAVLGFLQLPPRAPELGSLQPIGVSSGFTPALFAVDSFSAMRPFSSPTGTRSDWRTGALLAGSDRGSLWSDAVWWSSSSL
jgi:hypothetical protein